MIFYEDGYTTLESIFARYAAISQAELVSSFGSIARSSSSFSVFCSSGNVYNLYVRKIADIDSGTGLQKKDSFGNLAYKDSGDKLSEYIN